jgi:hypothetical protein
VGLKLCGDVVRFYGWVCVYILIARMAPPECLFICLSYEEWAVNRSLYPLSVCLQMDLMCLCLISVSTIICGKGCVERMCCKSNIVVCMSLVFSGRVIIDG